MWHIFVLFLSLSLSLSLSPLLALSYFCEETIKGIPRQSLDVFHIRVKSFVRTYTRIVWDRRWQRKELRCTVALIIRRATPKGPRHSGEYITFPINELWDLLDTATQLWMKRERYTDTGRTQRGDELRLRSGELPTLSLVAVEIDRFGRTCCHAFDRFTQDRSLARTHVLNVWQNVEPGQTQSLRDVISSCTLCSPKVCRRRERDSILGDSKDAIYTHTHARW